MAAQSRAGWTPSAPPPPPPPRSAEAPPAAVLGLGILAAAPRSFGLGSRHPGRRRRCCCSPGAGQRRRAPPAGRKGASAPLGPAVQNPGPRRRCPRCRGIGLVPAQRGRGRTFSARSVPDAPPGEAPRVPDHHLGVTSASPDSPARAAGHPGAGACARPGHLPRPPAGRGGAARPQNSASRVSSPASVSPVLLPRSAARRELPGDRGSGCCPPAQPLARRPPHLSSPLGPCPPVYMPVKPLGTPSPSEPQLPEGEASRPAN
ncbi:WAS/WASL-interacting protein family member 2-like [Saccopteryx bilineata]|uniref:WAS/WASL-interacting protein family member 2-like n=1 Tax=Saccopteryx bilineata TaxID=59482 RepID=UPI00338F07E2